MREQIESGKWLRRIKEVKKKLSGQKPHGSRAGEGSSPRGMGRRIGVEQGQADTEAGAMRNSVPYIFNRRCINACSSCMDNYGRGSGFVEVDFRPDCDQ
jgi:hypothetical protein